MDDDNSRIAVGDLREAFYGNQRHTYMVIAQTNASAHNIMVLLFRPLVCYGKMIVDDELHYVRNDVLHSRADPD